MIWYVSNMYKWWNIQTQNSYMRGHKNIFIIFEKKKSINLTELNTNRRLEDEPILLCCYCFMSLWFLTLIILWMVLAIFDGEFKISEPLIYWLKIPFFSANQSLCTKCDRQSKGRDSSPAEIPTHRSNLKWTSSFFVATTSTYCPITTLSWLLYHLTILKYQYIFVLRTIWVTSLILMKSQCPQQKCLWMDHQT